MDKIEEILNYLHNLKPIKLENTRSKFEVLIHGISNALRLICILLSLPLIGIALYAVYNRPMDSIWLNVAIWICNVQLILAITWIFLDILPMPIILILFNNYFHRVRQLECDHDFKSADGLIKYDIGLLKIASGWISIQTERLKSRMTFFLGGSDKLAIFALASVGWVAWKNIPNATNITEQYIYIVGLAFLSGLAIGGIFMNTAIKKLSYQKDILTIAIIQLENNLDIVYS